MTTRIPALALVAALACSVAAVPAATSATAAGPSGAVAAKKKHPKPPGASVIKGLLKKHWLGDDPERYKVSYRYTFTTSSIGRGKSRLGRYFYDGVPPNAKTWVFPIKATSVKTELYLPDGSTRTTTITGKYNFYRDEFKQWQYKSVDSDVQSRRTSRGAPSA